MGAQSNTGMCYSELSKTQLGLEQPSLAELALYTGVGGVPGSRSKYPFHTLWLFNNHQKGKVLSRTSLYLSEESLVLSRVHGSLNLCRTRKNWL